MFSRLLNAPTVTKIWLRYYLEQLFGERWRAPVNIPSGKSSRANSISTVRRRSRITYDRDQGMRYYKDTDFNDRNNCSCDDIWTEKPRSTAWTTDIHFEMQNDHKNLQKSFGKRTKKIMKTFVNIDMTKES